MANGYRRVYRTQERTLKRPGDSAGRKGSNPSETWVEDGFGHSGGNGNAASWLIVGVVGALIGTLLVVLAVKVGVG